jgi:nucleoside-diphosphate-sugar epimerase
LNCLDKILQNMPTILVTGGAGFFGGIVVRMLLEQGHRCISIDLQPHDYSDPRLLTVQADIRDLDRLRAVVTQELPQAIIHCAAVMSTGGEGDEFLWSSNVEGTRNIAEVAKENGIKRVVYVSTNCLWTDNVHRPIREDDAPAPIEIYGKSKLEGERVLRQYAGAFDLAILRCPAIIDRGRLGLLAILFEFIDEGRKIWVVGGGQNRYQWIYGRDAADACIRLLHSETGIFHAGADHPLPLRDIYQHVITHAGSKSRIASLPKRPALWAMRAAYKLGLSPLPPYFYKMIAEDFEFDSSKLRRITGWQPTMTNEQMLLEAYDYYRQNKAEIHARRNASTHRRPARMGVIRLLKWVS